jgi:hypothetical protein
MCYLTLEVSGDLRYCFFFFSLNGFCFQSLYQRQRAMMMLRASVSDQEPKNS